MDRLKQALFKAKSNKKINWLLSKNVLEEAIKEFPNEKVLYLELAELLNSKKMYVEAIKNFQKALKYAPNDDKIIFKIGTCFLSINEFALALDYYKQIDDDFPELIYNKAFALSKIDKISQSIEYIKKLIENRPSTDIPYLFLAELYYSQGLFNKAVETLTKAERIFGEKGAIFFIKGSAYSQMENWIHAATNYSKAYKLNFNYPHFHRNYAIALEKIGSNDKAIKILKRAITEEPNDFQSYFHLIRLYIAKQKYDEALELIKKSEHFVNKDQKIYLELLQKEISIYKKSEI